MNSLSLEPRHVAKGGRGKDCSLPDPNKLILPTTENMPFLTLRFRLQVWRILRFILFLCRKRVPHHNFWFHKMTLLVATFSKSPVSGHISTTIETIYIAETVNLVWSNATGSLGFPCHTFENVSAQNPSP